MDRPRLTATSLRLYRANMLMVQEGKCLLCSRVPEVPCLDHCHKSGIVRGVLCRGCNALLGVIENNMPRCQLTDVTLLSRVLGRIPSYLMVRSPLQLAQGANPYHSSFRTPEQKKVLVKKRKARRITNEKT